MQKILDADMIFPVSGYGIFISMLPLLWVCTAVLTMIGIALDMRSLGLNRVGLSRRQWVIASAIAGPGAGLFYLWYRRAARLRLFAAVREFAGTSADAPDLQGKRLCALEESGLLTNSIASEYRSKLHPPTHESRSVTAPPSETRANNNQP